MELYRISNQEFDWRFDHTRMRRYLILPDVQCSQCERDLSQYSDAARLPEQVPKDAISLLKPYVNKDYEKLVDLTPAEFFDLEKHLRSIYHLSEKRLILPRASLSPTVILRAYKPKWDAYLFRDLFFSKRLANELLRLEVSGIEFFPVYYRNGSEADVVEAVVFGEGGIPLLSKGGQWWHCPECRQYLLLADHPVKFSMNVSEWDGSDFFHFAKHGPVYVSERVYRLLSSPVYNAWEWLEFHSLSETWEVPYYPSVAESDS